MRGRSGSIPRTKLFAVVVEALLVKKTLTFRNVNAFLANKAKICSGNVGNVNGLLTN